MSKHSPSSDDRLCRCNCPLSVHMHMREGTDCAVCGPDWCPRFRAPSLWAQLRAAWVRR